MPADEQEMMKVMGFSGFDTTKVIPIAYQRAFFEIYFLCAW